MQEQTRQETGAQICEWGESLSFESLYSSPQYQAWDPPEL